MSGSGDHPGDDTFVIDMASLSELDLADVITDYADGEMLDLSAMLDALVGSASEATTAGGVTVVSDSHLLPGSDESSASSAGFIVDVGQLAGAHAVITILFEDQPITSTG